MASNVVRAAAEQAARLEFRLHQLGVQLPIRKPWDDDATYNDAMLEVVELEEERVAAQRHQALAAES